MEIKIGEMLGESQPAEKIARPINEDSIRQATQILMKYKSSKAHLESRIVASEQWWKLSQWHEIKETNPFDKKPVSAWLFNVIMGKHADAIESYPTPNILPREAGDRAEADMLSQIIPVVMQQNGFEETYSDASWQKMRQGTAIYSVLWDSTKLNGLGDIAIKKVDALNMFWKNGITDIEDSPNLFCVMPEDNETLLAQYPQLDGHLKSKVIALKQYIYDDREDTSNTSLVIDWYYKKRVGTKTVVHYCKYINDVILYASENDERLAETGYYNDDEYPFVFDPLFGIEGSPCGYGYIDICKSPQESIDELNQAIVKNAVMASTPRYFIRKDGAVNEAEFSDWHKPFVHVNGNLGDDTIKQIVVSPLDDIYVAVLNNKIEELKFTSGNQDVVNGGSTGGVTASSAIVALQESAGRSSRASTKSAYRAYAKIVNKVIERIRQFYDIPRKYRILGDMGIEQYVTFSNEGLKAQYQGIENGVDMGFRKPVFDIEVVPQKATQYTKMSQNELALQFFNLGFFNPQNTDQALAVLDMMDFDTKDEVMQKISANGTMYDKLIQYQQLALALTNKYEPQMAESLAQNILGGQQMNVPTGQKISLKDDKSLTEKQRESARGVGQPE